MIFEQATIDLLEVEIFRPIGGFIMDASKLDEGTLGADDDGDLNWVPTLSAATALQITRGGKTDSVGYAIDVGVMTVTLINSNNPAEDPNLQPNLPIRLKYRNTDFDFMFWGVISDINVKSVYDKDAGTVTDFVTITAVDRVQYMANRTRYGATAGPESFDDRLEDLGYPQPHPQPTPYMVSATVYEGPLSKHMDMVCNSVGAIWWVDTLNNVHTKMLSATESPVATFTDIPGDGNPGYVDISTSYDTRNIVNDLTLNEHNTQTGDDGTPVANDSAHNYKNIPLAVEWGNRAGQIDVTLATQTDLDNRAAEILAAYGTPNLGVTQIVFNVQEAPYISRLVDVTSQLVITYRGDTGTYRVINLSHEVSPTRWLLTLNLYKES